MSDRAVLAAAVAVVQAIKKCSFNEALKDVEDAWHATRSIESGAMHKELCQQLQAESEAPLPANGKKDAPGQQTLPGTTEVVTVKRGKPGKDDLVIAVPKASLSAPVAPKQANPADDWTPAPSPAVATVRAAVDAVVAAVAPPVPPPPDVPPTAPWAQKDCTACNGTGYNSKQGPCPICKSKASATNGGSSSTPPPATNAAPPTGIKLKTKVDPAIARLPMQVLFDGMECEKCGNDQIVFTVPQCEGAAKASFTCQKCNLVGSVDLDADTVVTIKKDGKVLAVTKTVGVDGAVETAEKKSRKKSEPVARLPIQEPPAEKIPAAPATPPDIKKLVDGVIGYEAAPINCDATRKELVGVVGAWDKARVIKKWEEVSGKVWKEDAISYDGMRSEIVSALLGKVGVE